ncbi:MAG TPA: hypothetical protein VNW28_05835 [Chthoniobacterales bacterium]|nr:hypothetical protein [Chthoniobacterales bacterium]
MSKLLRLSAILFFSATLLGEAAEKVAGRWEGSVQIPGGGFNLIVDLDQSGGKDWIGSVIIPGLGVKGAPLTEISVNDAGISFAIKGALASERVGQASCKAHLNERGQLTGDFLQAGNTAPFILQKTGPPQVELPRTSTAVSKDLEGVWKGDFEMTGYPRHVTLTLTNHESGPASAEFVVVGKRTTNAPVDLVLEEGGFLTIESHDIGITYEGRFRKEAGEIKGTFVLGPFELPLVLQRAP